ncbi:hypothetical protein, partial [Plasmopara viticola lesion associated botybirna 2]
MLEQLLHSFNLHTQNRQRELIQQPLNTQQIMSSQNRKATLSSMPQEIKDCVGAMLLQPKSEQIANDAANLHYCSKSTRLSFFVEDRFARGAYFTDGYGRKTTYYTAGELDYFMDLHNECGMSIGLYLTSPFWKRGEKAPVSDIDYSEAYFKLAGKKEFPYSKGPEHRLGGVLLKRGSLPTKVERAGVRFAAGASGDKEAEQDILPTEGIFQAMSQLAAEAELSMAATGVLERNDDRSDFSMTHSVMRAVPDIGFKDQFRSQEPTAKVQTFYVAWGYGLRSMPASLKGAGYSDKFEVKTWVPVNESVTHYGCVDSATGYANCVTNQVLAEATGNLADARRPDDRDFQSRFDEMKNLPTAFRLAGNSKATIGDNHVAFLTVAVLRILALKQAQECGARAKVQLTPAIVNTFGVDVYNAVTGRVSVFGGVATVLANTWFGSQRVPSRDESKRESVYNHMYDMVLPSSAADISEICYLAYLCGHFDTLVDWQEKDHSLGIRPVYAAITSDVTKRLRIPLANELRAYTPTEVSGFRGDLELGKAEAVLNRYVKQHDLMSQLKAAKVLATLCTMSSFRNKSALMLVGLPTPNHVTEYDLWCATAPVTNVVFGLVSQMESAGLLLVLCQLQSTMRDDVLAANMLAQLEKTKIPVVSQQAVASLRSWSRETFPGGYAAWARSWAQSVLGYSPGELRNLGNNNADRLLTSVYGHVIGSVLRVSSLLFFSQKVEEGSLGLFWDAGRRRTLSTQRMLGASEARVMRAIFKSSPSIFANRTVNWADLAADFTRRRDNRKIDAALGSHTLNTITGDPRIIYMGLKPTAEPLTERMAEAQDWAGMATHYEPYFDLSHAMYYTHSVVPLGVRPDDHRHDKDAVETSGKPNLPYASAGGDSVVSPLGSQLFNAAGRAFSAIVKSGLAKKPAGLTNTPPPRKLFAQADSGHVVAWTVKKDKHAQTNELKAMSDKLQAEVEERLEKALRTIERPEDFQGSEIVEITVDEAIENSDKLFARSNIVKNFAGLSDEQGVGLFAALKPIPVKGDGRCGMRALHASAADLLPDSGLDLNSLFEAEAKVLGLKLHTRAPSTHWVNDAVIANVAAAMGTAICIIDTVGNEDKANKGIRMYTPSNPKRLPVLYILQEDD